MVTKAVVEITNKKHAQSDTSAERKERITERAAAMYRKYFWITRSHHRVNMPNEKNVDGAEHPEPLVTDATCNRLVLFLH